MFRLHLTYAEEGQPVPARQVREAAPGDIANLLSVRLSDCQTFVRKMLSKFALAFCYWLASQLPPSSFTALRSIDIFLFPASRGGKREGRGGH